MVDQADVDRWAALIARAYAVAHRPSLPAADGARLARELNTPVASCIMLGIAPDAARIDPALARWEAMTGRRPGPRLGRVDYGRGAVEMRT